MWLFISCIWWCEQKRMIFVWTPENRFLRCDLGWFFDGIRTDFCGNFHKMNPNICRSHWCHFCVGLACFVESSSHFFAGYTFLKVSMIHFYVSPNEICSHVCGCDSGWFTFMQWSLAKWTVLFLLHWHLHIFVNGCIRAAVKSTQCLFLAAQN